ncbi:MAG: hypothetical protein [Olavius algarvensis Gamma 3 endosymbiont]|nr:MAG: hypothetical protein [Olavius algarvensis Gamma 3 endosymbiont]
MKTGVWEHYIGLKKSYRGAFAISSTAPIGGWNLRERSFIN